MCVLLWISCVPRALGGSVLASLSGFQKKYIYREPGVLPYGMPDDTVTYQEGGAHIVHQYCAN